MTGPSDADARPRVLIIVQNLPVPFDRRVWLECRALTAAGYDVTVVCPKGKDDPAHQVLDGVTLLKYRPYAPGGGALGFVVEYAYSFLATAKLVLRARRQGTFDVLQACNPPDIFWPIARWLRRLDGTRFVFDHHDLCPELYDSRFPQASRLPRRGLVALEKATFRTADHVVATNASYAEIAVRRGGKSPADVTVVRTGPDHERLQRANRVRRCGAAGGTSSRTSASWGRRTASTWRSGPRHTSSTTSDATTSPSLSWARATRTTRSWRCATSWDCGTTWSCPAECPTTPSSTCSRPPLSDFHPTRRTRSTTSPR